VDTVGNVLHRERWLSLMSGDPATWRLAEPVAVIDAVRTGIDPDDTLGRLDALAAAGDGDSFDDVHQLLFGELGFRGPADHHDHERNSLMSQVIDRRRGLPILLAVVAIDIAAAHGVALDPIGMPGHFLLRHDGDPDAFIDASGGGTLLDEGGCEALFRRSQGPGPAFDATMLVPARPDQVVARVLANLRMTYARRGELAQLRWVLELRSTVPGVPAVEAFERSAVLDDLGRHDEAAEVLWPLVTHPDERVRAAAHHRSQALRARNN
jgi:regulator of sirC expression with transglutaminase-like and TPR domain